VYSVTTDGEELYENLNKTGTLGFEVDYRIKTNWGYANIAYSYYKSNNKNEVDLYEVPNKSNILLGFPNHKVNLLSQIRMGKSFSLNPSLTFLSERYGVTNYDFNTDETTISGIEPTTLLNLNLLYENLLIDGLSVSVGVYDVLNSEYVYIQPYSGIHPQIPDGGREFTIKLSYRVK
jgi:outer membrane receptor for ferrienterochelin and colicin